MNISLEWNDKYNTGNEEIDYQHKYFLKLIKRFARITETETDHDYLKRLLNEIAYYAVFHFYSEENMMITAKYPMLQQHETLHMELIHNLNDQINITQYDNNHLINLIAFLVNWFVHHTVEEDLKFAEFIRGKE